jgi:hypothetical protein
MSEGPYPKREFLEELVANGRITSDGWFIEPGLTYWIRIKYMRAGFMSHLTRIREDRVTVREYVLKHLVCPAYPKCRLIDGKIYVGDDRPLENVMYDTYLLQDMLDLMIPNDYISEFGVVLPNKDARFTGPVLVFKHRGEIASMLCPILK